MHPSLLIPLLAAIAAAAIAGAILTRDSGQRANRLVAVALLCSAHWSLCEIFWSTAEDPDTARWLLKLSALGWLWMGPLAFHIYLEVLGDVRRSMRRLVPVAYASAAASIALYMTPWCVGEPVRTSFGWGITSGPLFPVAFAPTVFWIGLTLTRWASFFSNRISAGERRQARWLFVGIAFPMAIATVTDVLLPSLGIHVPRLGSSSVVAVGLIVAISVSRHGYFLLAPGAFTREILETLRDAVALLHLDGRIRTCNPALAVLYGCTVEGLRDTPIEALLPGFEKVKVPAAEMDLVPVSGAPFRVSMSSALLKDDEGMPVGRVLAIRDLREVEALRGRVVVSDRLAAVGELAAGIAHEINNPITWVRTNLSILRDHWETLKTAEAKTRGREDLGSAFAEGQELLDESIEGVDRMATIAREVGAFSHAGLGESEFVDINALVENAVNVAALSFSVIVERCYEDVPRVRCAPQQIKQLFLNLLLNALQAVEDYGRIRLVTTLRGDRVVVRVEDDGGGIPADDIDRVFDPFFTTRPAGEGVGLGLAHCHQIVQNHGGEISVESRPGVGTAFEVCFPS